MYQRLTAKRNDNDGLKKCMEDCVEKLLSSKTDVENPGMLLGDIQSGKTRAFTGVIALGFDKKYNVTVVLTKGTKALVKQTVQRFKSEFQEFEDEDILRVFDVMEIPDDLNEYVIERQKLVLVVKKEDDNINRLKRLFFETYPNLQNKKVLIVDDEADFVSIGYRSKKNESGEKEINLNVISKQISDFRKSLQDGSDYLQVTATPYSLYLQPENIEVKEISYAPMRPKFTIVLPRHQKYIGSNYYFEESQLENSPAQYLFQAIDEEELKSLSKTHGKILDNVLNSSKVKYFRTAIINYVVASCIRIIQSERKGKNNYKSSFIIHTETGKLKHDNQSNLVNKLVESLKVEGKMKSSVLRECLFESYGNMKLSISLTDYFLPPFEEVFEKACDYVRYITIRKINSDNDILSLLNISTGELRLESPLNIFIGGQILDRGITIQNLIGFFYGRNPKKMQQDTVMQHARIFGARSLEDMAVTRLYTTSRIYESMKRMHESDKALRNAFEKGGANKKVAFIQKAADGKIIPCSPNKLLISNTVTVKPSGTLRVYGFQTQPKTYISKKIERITETLTEINSDYEDPFLIPVGIAQELIDRIYDTFESDTEIYGCTREEFKAALDYTTNQTNNQDLRGKLYCFSNNKGKNNARYKENQRGKMFNDSYFDGKTDSVKAKKFATDVPVLFLSFQNGLKEADWRDAHFYWPVLFIQKNIVTSIFTTEVNPGEVEEV
jgi:hypothetical protein